MDASPCQCAHPGDTPAVRRVCVHLLENPVVDHSQYFWNSTTAYHLICAACRVADAETRDAALRTVCEGCYQAVDAQTSWDTEHPFCGQPGVRVRDGALVWRAMTVLLPSTEHLTWKALAPVLDGACPVWLALSDHLEVWRLDLHNETTQRLGPLTALPSLEGALDLRCSACGGFVALVEHKGSRGVVARVGQDGLTHVMDLNRGTYQVQHCVFPVAFFRHEGRACLVHATAWNRLEVTDLETKAALTERVLEPYDRERRPAHYLDYFFCRLDVSPDEQRVMTAGWVWAPVGGIRAWSLSRWLTQNPFESEDGPSVRTFAWRYYFWDGPGCWIDATRVVLWGYGPDDIAILPAAWIFDADSGEALSWFPGPARGDFYVDRHLLVVSPKEGLSAWDLTSAERLFEDSSLRPTSYHPTARLFLTRDSAKAWRLGRLVPAV